MRAGVFALAAVLHAPAAWAWDSECYLRLPGVPARPDDFGPRCPAGPFTAHQRWIGRNTEHRQLFVEACDLAGLPERVCSGDVNVRVFTGNFPIATAAYTVPSYLPVPFARAERVRERTWQIAELAQLPDFAYSLWDWATGMEHCPLIEVIASPAECHDFASHMGGVNSNHFPPQTGYFYQYLHDLARQRARECASVRSRLTAADGGPGAHSTFVEACEVEALTMEAHAQHYLQDSWSMGHLWNRWGSPDLLDFPPDQPRTRAVLIGAAAGIIHGTRGVVQPMLEERGLTSMLDCNDGMCGPHAPVTYVFPGIAPARGVGDFFLSRALPREALHRAQIDRLLGCSVVGLRSVYEALGHAPGELSPRGDTSSLVLADPSTPESPCYQQRATNFAMSFGTGIDFVNRGLQARLDLDGWSGYHLTPAVAEAAASVGMAPIPLSLAREFRDDFFRTSVLARLLAIRDPFGTTMARAPIPFLGMRENSAYVHPERLARYIDPLLPWPATRSVSSPGDGVSMADRALALARMFHRAHAADWCPQTTTASLEALRARSRDVILDAEGHAAACEACTEFTERHLRVGTSVDAYDHALEPVCHYLGGRDYVYVPRSSAGATPRSLAEAWCGCSPRFGGAWAQCGTTCRDRNPLTGDCGCTADTRRTFIDAGMMPADCGADPMAFSLVPGDLAFCGPVTPLPDDTFAGVFLLTPAVGTCVPTCRVPNTQRSPPSCGCPGGAERVNLSVVAEACPGRHAPATLGVCLRRGASGPRDFGGAYQVDDPITGGMGCRASNPFTSGCACPSGFRASPFRAMASYTSSTGRAIPSTIYVCMPGS
ncbi:MAG: hypothetical protein HY909_15415 [Deltaproteobacteria bacterium]|nr:hypothetical protein [Deltaproteobacteria bacterium]